MLNIKFKSDFLLKRDCYLFDSAFPLVHIFFKPALSLSNRIGRVVRIPNAMSAKESVVNLATPHCDDAKAIIDNCIEILI